MHGLKSSHSEFLWVTFLEKTTFPDLQHAFNSVGPRFCVSKSFPDGYSPATKTIMYFNQCQIHGHDLRDLEQVQGQLVPCSQLPAFATYDSLNIYKVSFRSALLSFYNTCRRIRQEHSHLVERILVMHSCEFDKALRDPRTPLGAFYYPQSHASKKGTFSRGALPPRPASQLSCREAIRGGAVEAVALLATSDETTQLYYKDINSL